MEMDEKTLILVRHAHRDTSQRELDNGLSEKGKEQAATLFKTLKRIYSLREIEDIHICASPKLRCVETLAPIATYLKSEIATDPLLLERGESELATKFQGRIEKFLNNWKSQSKPITIACSHGDWLPIAIEILTNAKSEFKKGGWVEITLSGDQPMFCFRN